MSLPQHHVAVETVVFDFVSADKPQVLLIKRGHEPYKNFWAIPGGFLEENEDIPEGATRELVEETGVGVHADDLCLITALSRDDQRSRKTIIVVYSIVVDKTEWKPAAGDDAIDVGWFPVDDMPTLACDHQDIVFQALGEMYYDPR